MNRRDFLIKTLGGTAGIIAIRSLIHDASLYSEKELEKEEIFSTNLNSLEKVIMMENVLTETYSKFLTNLHKEIMNTSKIDYKTEEIKDEISELMIKSVREFLIKIPKNEKLREIRNKINRKYSEISGIKEEKIINFSKFKREIYAFSQDNILWRRDSSIDEINKFNNNISILNSFEENENENSLMYRSYKTLLNLSPDSEFILNASKISRVPIEEIVAFADIESLGREFAIGKGGEINRFQLHPRYLRNIFENALAQKNSLADYIKENTSRKTLLADTIRNSKLNIALAVNFMKALKEQTKTYYEYVLSYNRGLGRVQDIPQRIRKRLENPKTITEQAKKYSIYKYYTNFLNAKTAFKEVQNYITKST